MPHLGGQQSGSASLRGKAELVLSMGNREREGDSLGGVGASDGCPGRPPGVGGVVGSLWDRIPPSRGCPPSAPPLALVRASLGAAAPAKATAPTGVLDGLRRLHHSLRPRNR